MTSGKCLFLGFLIGVFTVLVQQFVWRDLPQACPSFPREIQEAQND